MRQWVTGFLGACTFALAIPAGAGMLEGVASYRERILLPADAVFEAELQDASRADAAADVVARARVERAGGSPYRFRLSYDDAAVQAGGRYVVRATIRHRGRLLFTTDTVYPAFGNQPLNLRLVAVSGGMPVRPLPVSDSPLVNTYWKLVSLAGTPVQVAARQREPHLVFALQGGRVSGSGGCNRLMGSYVSKSGRLVFGQMTSTMMACAEGMTQEHAFLQGLGKVTGYRIAGSELELLDEGGTVVAAFVSVALR